LIEDAETGSELQRSHKNRKEDLKEYRRLWIKGKWSHVLLSRKYHHAKSVTQRSRLRRLELKLELERYEEDMRGLEDDKLELLRTKERLQLMVRDLLDDAEDNRRQLERAEKRVTDLEDAFKDSQRAVAELQMQNDLLQDELAAWKPTSWS